MMFMIFMTILVIIVIKMVVMIMTIVKILSKTATSLTYRLENHVWTNRRKGNMPIKIENDCHLKTEAGFAKKRCIR